MRRPQHGLPFPGHFIVFRYSLYQRGLFLDLLAVAFTTHPCSTIGAHAAMVCVVVIQAHLHSLLPSCPSLLSLPVAPLSHSPSLPATVYKSPCLSWCMRRGLRPDVLAARARDQGSWPIFHTFQHPGAEQLQTQAGCQRLYHGVMILV